MKTGHASETGMRDDVGFKVAARWRCWVVVMRGVVSLAGASTFWFRLFGCDRNNTSRLVDRNTNETSWRPILIAEVGLHGTLLHELKHFTFGYI